MIKKSHPACPKRFRCTHPAFDYPSKHTWESAPREVFAHAARESWSLAGRWHSTLKLQWICFFNLKKAWIGYFESYCILRWTSCELLHTAYLDVQVNFFSPFAKLPHLSLFLSVQKTQQIAFWQSIWRSLVSFGLLTAFWCEQSIYSSYNHPSQKFLIHNWLQSIAAIKKSSRSFPVLRPGHVKILIDREFTCAQKWRT